MWDLNTLKEINRPKPDLDKEKRSKLWHYINAWKKYLTNNPK